MEGRLSAGNTPIESVEAVTKGWISDNNNTIRE